jgi:hypothetical protein
VYTSVGGRQIVPEQDNATALQEAKN